ncbi:hypothetical protein E6P97_02115 [Patescibacteria group bacterium]|nr:MAG: hypothetical protein E6P97_02115 [Patescibacteria group bacterium]
MGLISDILARIFLTTDGDDRNPIAIIIGIVAGLVAPIVAIIIQAAISRQREFLADATGVMTTRDPEGLASALEKLGNSSTVTRRQNSSTAHLFFANPLRSSAFSNIFSTHPPIDQRVARLRDMGDKF